MELRVVSPPDGAVYLVDPTLRREFQTIGLRATSAASTRIEWRVDGSPIGTSGSLSSMRCAKTPDGARSVDRMQHDAEDGRHQRIETRRAPKTES